VLDTAQRQVFQAVGLAQSYLPCEYRDDLDGQVPVAEAVRCRKLGSIRSRVEADQKMLVTEEEAVLVGSQAVLGDSCSAGNVAVVEVAVLECRPGMAIGDMALVVAVRCTETKMAASVAAAAADLCDGRVVGLQTTGGLPGFVQDSSRVWTASRLETDADWEGKRHFLQAASHSL